MTNGMKTCLSVVFVVFILLFYMAFCARPTHAQLPYYGNTLEQQLYTMDLEYRIRDLEAREYYRSTPEDLRERAYLRPEPSTMAEIKLMQKGILEGKVPAGMSAGKAQILRDFLKIRNAIRDGSYEY